MAVSSRSRLAVLMLVLAGWPISAGAQDVGDRPRVLEPSRPSDRHELDRREALKLYGLGLLCERDHRLLEAMHNFEEAARLDPASATLQRTLVPIYLALERGDDALTACRKALDFAPEDHDSWYLAARLYRARGDTTAACKALNRALRCPALRDQPDMIVGAASALGELCEELKDYAGAAEAYKEVADVLENPNSLIELAPLTPEQAKARLAEVRERIGMLWLQAKQFDKAADSLRRAQKTDPEMGARLNWHLARVYQAQNRPAEALKVLDQFLALQPPNVEVYELKIALLKQLQREGDIVEQLRAHALRDKHNVALQLLLAGELARARRFPEAEERYKSIVQESPSPEAYRGLFTLYRLVGERGANEMLDMLDRTLKEAHPRSKDGEETQPPGTNLARFNARCMLAVLRDTPELVATLLGAAEQDLKGRRFRSRDHDTWKYLAVLAHATKQLDAAERIYRGCLDDLDAEGNQSEHEIYTGMLDVLFEKKKFDEIILVCRKGLKDAKTVNRLVFYQSLAIAYSQLGKYAEALAEAEQAIPLASNERSRVSFSLRRAQIIALLGKTDQAVAACEELLREVKEAGSIRDIRYRLSGIYSEAHQLAKSEETLKQILEADPDDDVVNNDLGYIWADQGKNLEEAEKLIRKAIQLNREQKRTRSDVAKNSERTTPFDDQDHAAYIDSLGWVLFRRGQLEEARKELERAVKLPDGNDDPVMWDHLGDVYLRLQLRDQARAAFKQALQRFNTDRYRKRDDQYKELVHKLELLEH